MMSSQMLFKIINLVIFPLAEALTFYIFSFDKKWISDPEKSITGITNCKSHLKGKLSAEINDDMGPEAKEGEIEQWSFINDSR